MPFFLYYLRGTSKMSGLQSSSFCPQNNLFMLGRNKTKQQITALIPSSFPTSLHSPPKVSQSDPFIHTLFFPFFPLSFANHVSFTIIFFFFFNSENWHCWVWFLWPISGEDYDQTRPHSSCNFSNRLLPLMPPNGHPILQVKHLFFSSFFYLFVIENENLNSCCIHAHAAGVLLHSLRLTTMSY